MLYPMVALFNLGGGEIILILILLLLLALGAAVMGVAIYLGVRATQKSSKAARGDQAAEITALKARIETLERQVSEISPRH